MKIGNPSITKEEIENVTRAITRGDISQVIYYGRPHLRASTGFLSRFLLWCLKGDRHLSPAATTTATTTNCPDLGSLAPERGL